MDQRIDKRPRTDSPHSDDFRALLALGPRLVGREITAGQWVTVARLLQTNLVSHWDQVGVLVKMTGEEAKAGFVAWLSSQVDLYQRTGIGLTADEAAVFAKFADALAGGAR